jgi:hypothetical protein
MLLDKLFKPKSDHCREQDNEGNCRPLESADVNWNHRHPSLGLHFLIWEMGTIFVCLFPVVHGDDICLRLRMVPALSRYPTTVTSLLLCKKALSFFFLKVYLLLKLLALEVSS